MRGNEFLDKMELVDPAYVKAADEKTKPRKSAWLNWGALAACLCLVIGAFAVILRFGKGPAGPQSGELVLSERTTAKVSYGYEGGTESTVKGDLEYLTEEEMFGQENMYVFRGRVSGLTNVTVDFNGEKEARCIASVEVEKVYQGGIAAGEQISMLLPCAVAPEGSAMEDTAVISKLEVGMEGIFMPMVYDENSFVEMNGAVLQKQDLAVCGLADGMRWAFLSTGRGLLFARDAYPGAESAETLDDVEAYLAEMLK